MEKKAQTRPGGGQTSESRPPNTTVPKERSSLDLNGDPKVIPKNTFNEIEGNPLEYGIHRIHFTKMSPYK